MGKPRIRIATNRPDGSKHGVWFPSARRKYVEHLVSALNRDFTDGTFWIEVEPAAEPTHE